MRSIERHYLDHNATAPLRPAAHAAMVAALAAPANPSSIHAEGRRARGLVEAARRQVAELGDVESEAVFFTSGATEGAAQALTPNWIHGGRARILSRLLVGATEHPCILSGGRFDPAAVTRIGVDREGRIDLEALDRAAAATAAGETMLVAVQAANSETGVLQPVREAGEIARRHGGLLVCDAVQLAGRGPISPEHLGADLVLVSSHKLGGPAGAAAVLLASADCRPAPLLRGGGQERGARAGTENVAAIAGFGAAAEDIQRKGIAGEAARLRGLRDHAEAGIRRLDTGATIFGGGAERLPNTSCFALAGLTAQTALMSLDLAGVAVSSGSACASGKVGRSHVLEAMGVADTVASGAIRVSFGWNSTIRDAAAFLSALERTVATLTMERHRRSA